MSNFLIFTHVILATLHGTPTTFSKENEVSKALFLEYVVDICVNNLVICHIIWIITRSLEFLNMNAWSPQFLLCENVQNLNIFITHRMFDKAVPLDHLVINFHNKSHLMLENV